VALHVNADFDGHAGFTKCFKAGIRRIPGIDGHSAEGTGILAPWSLLVVVEKALVEP
jgi:hypothetical protein